MLKVERFVIYCVGYSPKHIGVAGFFGTVCNKGHAAAFGGTGAANGQK